MAKALLERNEPEMFRGVGFNSQQCAEKAIKGFLTYKKIHFEKIHDIVALSKEVLVVHPELEALLKETAQLTHKENIISASGNLKMNYLCDDERLCSLMS